MSRPPTPEGRNPQSDTNHRFRLNGTACEWGESYHPGGYHPVHLGDVFEGRYEVIRKLGYGSYSTVWLASDRKQDRLVAIKVLVARISASFSGGEFSLYQILRDSKSNQQHIVGLEDSFEIEGPNGKHTCLVFQPMGPHFSDYLYSKIELRHDKLFKPRLPTDLVRKILREVLLGLQSLHSNGIVHGDLHQGNILVNINMDALTSCPIGTVRQVSNQGVSLERLDGKKDLWAPAYLLQPSPLNEFVSTELSTFTKVADLGQAFLENNPPTKITTPARLRSPEHILGLKLSKGVDIWSFGCLMFQLLTDSPLFGVDGLEGNAFYDDVTNDEHLIQIFEILGPLPSYMFQHWRRGFEYFDSKGNRLWTSAEGTDLQEESDSDCSSNSQSGSVDSTRELSNDTNEYTTDESESSKGSAPLANPPRFKTLEKRFRRRGPGNLDEIQEKELVTLLRWILQPDPKLRPSVDQILQVAWFQID